MSLQCDCILISYGTTQYDIEPYPVSVSGYDDNGNPIFNFTQGSINFTISFNTSYSCGGPIYSSDGIWEIKDDIGNLYATACLFTVRTTDCPFYNPWDLSIFGSLYFTYFVSEKCPPPVYDCISTGVNECNVITLFEMGVNCVVQQPSQPDSSDGVASLIITGGTPPYTILWSNGNVGPAIYNLSAGEYDAIVVDSYGDFTANTTCVLTGITTTTSTTSTTTTSPYPNLYELCMVTNMLVQGSYVETQTHFTPNGIYDGKPTWISDDGQNAIIWDTFASQWVVSAATPTLYVISNLNPTYPPIYGSWFLIGATGSVIVYEGFCNSLPIGLRMVEKGEMIQPLTMTVSQNQTICGCDGGLTISSNGGYPPYTYSIDGGLTFKSIPIFNNLCSGSYNVLTQDSVGQITSKTIKLNQPSQPITYIISLNTTSELIENSTNRSIKEYTTTINITPSLPDNTYIFFDIVYNNLSKSSPNGNSAKFRNETMLTINGEGYKYEKNSDKGETLSTFPGCQSNIIYSFSRTQKWSELSLSNKDYLLIKTVEVIIKNESVDCYVGTSEQKYSISNLKLKGCNCCSAISE